MATVKKSAVKKTTTATKKVAVSPVKKTQKAAAPVVSKKTVVKVVKKATPTEKVKSEMQGLTTSVIGVDGKVQGKMTLPAELFDQPENKQLVAQAVRVFLANQREGGANTKTRGQVEGSTRKIYRQKGTGRARHGSIRAHIFVGGGIAFGPVTHDFSLTMPTKMKRKALASALTTQYKAGNIVFIGGLAGLESKTKPLAHALSYVTDLTSTLLVLADDAKLVARSSRNIQGVDTIPATSVNTYEVLAHKKIIFMKEAVSLLKDAVSVKKPAATK